MIRLHFRGVMRVRNERAELYKPARLLPMPELSYGDGRDEAIMQF